MAPLLARSNLLITRDIEWANLVLGFEQVIPLSNVFVRLCLLTQYEGCSQVLAISFEVCMHRLLEKQGLYHILFFLFKFISCFLAISLLHIIVDV